MGIAWGSLAIGAILTLILLWTGVLRKVGVSGQ